MDFLRTAWNRYGKRREEAVEYSLSVTPASPLHNCTHDYDDIRPREPGFRFQLRRRAALLGIALLPSFLTTPKDKPPRKLSKTSYLDGLRGVAALFVVLHHYAIIFTETSQEGYLSDTSPETYKWILLFPLIRVIHSGRFMVAIFFVISGFVLSYRGLKLARERRSSELLESLGSSVFRRWLRLHLPVIASTFLAFLLTRAGAFTNLTGDWQHASGVAKRAPLPATMGSFSNQFWDWYEDTKQLCDPLRYGAVFSSKYNINILWTIPLEWMGSMLVFVTVLGIARTRTWVKVAVLVGLISWCHNTARWEPATFLSGTLLAEFSLMKEAVSEGSSSPALGEKATRSDRLSRFLYIAPKIFWPFLFLFGLYIGSHPQIGAPSTPGYRTLMSLIPSQYSTNSEIFYLAFGAVIVVFALENAIFLQSIFTTSIAQYLGDISFSLYMLHGLVEFTLGQWLIPNFMDVTGGWANGQVGFGGGMLLASLVLGPVTIWVSDVFSRSVDERCVRFARWVGDKCKAPK